MWHHITVSGVPLCRVNDIITRSVRCCHRTKPKAKSAVLQLIEQNPLHPIGSYKVNPEICPEVIDIY